MVWLESTDAPALSITDHWNKIRDGAPLSVLRRPTFGFRVTKYFKSPSALKSEFLPGMQGQVLHRQGVSVFVEVVDLFGVNGNFLKDWIHKDFIAIGTELYGTWKIDVCNIPRALSNFTADEHRLFNDPKCKHLALGISTFLRKLAQTNPECLSQDNFNRLGGSSGGKVPWITAKVIGGVDKAGLLTVLNNPQYTIQDLEANAALDCGALTAQNEAGIYLRRYIEPNPDQSKKSCSVYVGQSVDFYSRFKSWIQAGHEDLIKRSDSVEMRAICRLELVFYREYKYIVEQLFTSLFQTYKQTLLNRTANSGDVQSSFHTKNCSDMDKIATASANDSGWTGAVQRKSFWNGSFSTCVGLNYQSPVSEGPLNESFVWLEKDGWIPDPDKPGKSIPVSNFTRDVPKKMTGVNTSAASASKTKSYILFDMRFQTRKDYCFRVSRTLPDDLPSDGVEWPAKGSFFNITFEVRTDWKPHPFSWARLPLIGPFEDWDRANSWAMSLNWVDASGKPRLKYLHCERPYMILNKDSMASIQPYARGIEVIQWLFNEKIPAKYQHRWVQTLSRAIVKVIKHDHVHQRITLEAGRRITTIPPISSKRKDPEVIKREMDGGGVHGDFGLDNVGLTLAEAKKATPGKWGSRRKCDCCMFYARSTGPGGCTFKDGNIVCESCLRVFGRPACSWTLGIPSMSLSTTDAGNSFEDLASLGDTANALRRKALHGLPGSTGDALAIADPQMMEVDQGDDELELNTTEGEPGEEHEVWGGP